MSPVDRPSHQPSQKKETARQGKDSIPQKAQQAFAQRQMEISKRKKQIESLKSQAHLSSQHKENWLKNEFKSHWAGSFAKRKIKNKIAPHVTPHNTRIQALGINPEFLINKVTDHVYNHFCRNGKDETLTGNYGKNELAQKIQTLLNAFQKAQKIATQIPGHRLAQFGIDPQQWEGVKNNPNKLPLQLITMYSAFSQIPMAMGGTININQVASYLYFTKENINSSLNSFLKALSLTKEISTLQTQQKSTRQFRVQRAKTAQEAIRVLQYTPHSFIFKNSADAKSEAQKSLPSYLTKFRPEVTTHLLQKINAKSPNPGDKITIKENGTITITTKASLQQKQNTLSNFKQKAKQAKKSVEKKGDWLEELKKGIKNPTMKMIVGVAGWILGKKLTTKIFRYFFSEGKETPTQKEGRITKLVKTILKERYKLTLDTKDPHFKKNLHKILKLHKVTTHRKNNRLTWERILLTLDHSLKKHKGKKITTKKLLEYCEKSLKRKKKR